MIYRECSSCHRPGESGPFALLSYHDAVKKAARIRFVTQTGYMPPWPADPSYQHFTGERVLSKKERVLIKQWVDSGMPRGDSLKEPPPPQFQVGSYFGKPDLVIYANEAVRIKGNGQDAFLIWKFPYSIEKDTLVDLVEFVPHQRKLVHHVNGHLVSYDARRKFNYMKGKSVHTDTRKDLFKVYEEMNIPYTDGKSPQYPTLTPNAVYYLPGYTPPSYPDDVGGYRLKKNGLFLLNNIHYGPSSTDLWDSSHINVFFRKKPLQRTVVESQLGTFGLSAVEPELKIPAGKIQTFHTRYSLPNTISMISINPHMHLIGKSFLAYAIRPNGDTVRLIHIPKWNFRWQYYYTFRNPIKLERGTVIHVYGTYDNTAQNPDNPNHPPNEINEGNGIESMKTSEEMFQFIYTYMSYREGDEFIDLERKTGKTSARR
ncbi:MAG TPA: cytochrome c [Bacteroidia bacterium]|nr:cytochrome c [Bacteroidia bacterium]